jgi:hypothetical protein
MNWQLDPDDREHLELRVPSDGQETRPTESRRRFGGCLPLALIILLASLVAPAPDVSFGGSHETTLDGPGLLGRGMATLGASSEPAVSSIQRGNGRTAHGAVQGGRVALGLADGEAGPLLSIGSEEPTGEVGTVLIGGTLSYVDAKYGPDYLALPFPRGTVAEICGPADCVTRRSTDYGPDQRVHPDRIADLSAADFVRVCGVPLSAGLCRGSVELEPSVSPDDDRMRDEDRDPLPATDAL